MQYIMLFRYFYLIIIAYDRGVYMLISIALLSNGFEANQYDQSHVDVCLKVLVLHLAEHPHDINCNEP